MLTDTTFCLDLIDERRERRRGAAHAFIAAHRAQQLRVSIVTWEEIAEGLASSADVDLIFQQDQWGRNGPVPPGSLRVFRAFPCLRLMCTSSRHRPPLPPSGRRS